MLKKIFTIIAALALLTVGSIWVLSSTDTKSVLRLPSLGPYDSGWVRPDADDTIDLGTSSLEFKDGYFDGTVYADAISNSGTLTNTGDITCSADIRSAVMLGIGAMDAVKVSSGTTIVPTSSFITLTATASLIMHDNANPHIQVTGFSLGDFLIVTTTEAFSFTLAEGSDEQIQGATLVVDQYDMLFFILTSTDTTDADSGARFWQQIGYLNN